MSRFRTHGLGWIPDLPDPRDYTTESEVVRCLFTSFQLDRDRSFLPAAVDLRVDPESGQPLFPPVEHQTTPHNCTADSVLALVEYFERRGCGNFFQGSQVYLHQVTQKLRRANDDVGADLRTTIKALRRFGTPPFELWPNESPTGGHDKGELELIAIGFARDFDDLYYLRLDSPQQRGQVDQSLVNVKSFLAAGFPVVFGYPVPRSLIQASSIPYRPQHDSYLGGVTAVAVGYDDSRPTSPRGGLLIRTTWGAEWGDAGYGWLPYAYVERQLARDFWALVKPGWMDRDEFSYPSVLP